MGKQAKSQESKIKIIPYDKVKDLRCSNQITYLKDNLHQSYQILKNGEFYIHMPKAFVNSALFLLFGSLSDLDKEDKKFYQDKTTQKQKNLIVSFFKQVSPPPQKQTSQREADFIDHLHKHSNSIMIGQIVVEMGMKVWDKFGPNLLSTKYTSVYFNLENYQSKKSKGKPNKTVLISQFDQTEEKIALCFFQTKERFSKDFIDEIKAQALKQQKKELSKIKEKELSQGQKQEKKQESSHSANSKSKDKSKPQYDQEGQQPKMQKVENKKQQNSSLFQALSFIFLVALILVTWHEHEYQKEFTQAEFDQKTYKINEFELKILQTFKESRQFLSPYKESVAQWSSDHISPWVDAISGTFSEIVNHEIVTNATQIMRNDIYLGFKAVEQVVGQIFVENKAAEQSSQQQLL